MCNKTVMLCQLITQDFQIFKCLDENILYFREYENRMLLANSVVLKLYTVGKQTLSPALSFL